jgi:hypothetical protein
MRITGRSLIMQGFSVKCFRQGKYVFDPRSAAVNVSSVRLFYPHSFLIFFPSERKRIMEV